MVSSEWCAAPWTCSLLMPLSTGAADRVQDGTVGRSCPSPHRRQPQSAAGTNKERALVPIVTSKYRIRVNPITCDAFGYCAELVPEIIHRDEWGYPMLADGPVPPRLFELAKRAVRECPRRALLLEKIPSHTP